MALAGVSKYWSRHKDNIGKGVEIDGELYEVFVDAVYDEAGMVAPKIVYFTNSINAMFNRSHNWFASRMLFYKTGFIKDSSWNYVTNNDANKYYKDTAAHEIAHELLLSYGGTFYSYGHKGTSHDSLVIQDAKEGTTYPLTGEIDLMKYANETYYPARYFERVVLAEKDCLSLLWLTKIGLK